MTPFLKLHGTGNDFVLIDARVTPVVLGAATVQRLAHRQFGIGCDQLLVLRPSSVADVAMDIFNADGSQISTCGNATRCVADFVMREKETSDASIETSAGIRSGWRGAGDSVTVNMGAPRWEWRDVPLAESRNTLHLGIEEGALIDPVAVSMGNPHVVFFVRDLSLVKMELWGKALEHHPLFPERANISAVEVVAPDHLKMVVWERGTGLTLACGSAACAAVVAGVRRERCARQAMVELPGGTLSIEWKKGDSASHGDVWMSGPVARVFEGRF